MIVAIKEKDKVVVGYNNLDGMCRCCESDYVDEDNVAMKFSSNGRLYACAEMKRSSDKLLYDESFIENDDVTPKSIIREIIPFIKETCVDNTQKSSNDENGWNNALIICDNDTIYDVGPKFKFSEISDYVCHGYYCESLKSVLDDTTSLPAEERILKAFTFVCKITNESMCPFIITDTKSKQFKIVKGDK